MMEALIRILIWEVMRVVAWLMILTALRIKDGRWPTAEKAAALAHKV